MLSDSTVKAIGKQMDEVLRLLRAIVYGDTPTLEPTEIGEAEPISERYEGMAHWIKNKQHMAAVPLNKGIVKQELRILEDDVEVVPFTEVGFDMNDGTEKPPLVEYWAEVGKTVGREVRYTRDDGTVSATAAFPYDQQDNFEGPMVDPVDLGEAEQIDETDSDTRPT